MHVKKSRQVAVAPHTWDKAVARLFLESANSAGAGIEDGKRVVLFGALCGWRKIILRQREIQAKRFQASPLRLITWLLLKVDYFKAKRRQRCF